MQMGCRCRPRTASRKITPIRASNNQLNRLAKKRQEMRQEFGRSGRNGENSANHAKS